MRKFLQIVCITLLVAGIALGTTYEWTRQPTQSQKIGHGSVIGASGSGAICISSCDGMAYVNAAEACQIGTGNNTTEGSLQYRDTVIIDGDGGLGIRMYGLMQLKYIFWQEDFAEGGYVHDAALANESDPSGGKFSSVADTAAWLVSIVDGNSDGDEIIVVNDDGHGGILKVETTDKALDSVECQLNGESFQFQTGEEAWFNARWASEDVSANTNVVGLGTVDTDFIDSLPNDHIVFMNQGSNLYFSVGQNGTATEIDTGVDLDDGEYVTTSFYWDGASNLTVAVNGTAITTLVDNASTVLFPDDEALSPVFGIQTTDTGKDYMLVDYIGCFLER